MSVPGPELWAPLVGAMRRAGASISRHEERALRAATGLRRIYGATNRLYAYRHKGQDYCLKTYRSARGQGQDGPARAAREWRALALLAGARVEHAPQPIYFDHDPALPIVVMRRVAGRPVRRQRLSPAMLGALADALRMMHQITPAMTEQGALPVLFEPQEQQRWLRAQLEALDKSSGGDRASEALRSARAWLRGPDPAILLASAPLVFSRADANLANCVWDGRRMALVDYEYSGWRDRPADLADLIELDRAWSIIMGVERAPEAAWHWFIERCSLSPDEHERFLAAQRFLAWVWVIRTWPRPEGMTPARERQFAAHLQRAQGLCAPMIGP